ncbi:MAG: UDP-N-acetylmuramoyl-tripeptide--D-alanyl-D-alanine ligase [Candidatus Atribacteria bacterium]|nr:MAG: UDP-N-acetylmuramoyl-tripeptide--D-alanyl-D-alanine ligase [Candidatus Atribacteria bacterium]
MFSVEKIAQIVEGKLLRSDGAWPTRAIHDSRLVQPGDLFVALPGSHTDGHVYIGNAFAAGACAALVANRQAFPTTARNIIVVRDPALALQQLASAWRDTQSTTFVAITGSNGKTTVKALLGHVLASYKRTYVSPRNYNTEIGLPIALLSMPENTQLGIFELGAERPGDIAMLANMLRPSLGILTSVGPSHLDGLGSIASVAAEKWSLAQAIPHDGTIIINADSQQLIERAGSAGCPVISAGLNGGDLRGHVLQAVPNLTIHLEGNNLSISCGLLGAHNAANVLLAAAAAHALGMDWSAISDQAASFKPIPHRLEPISASFGTILDDTYNANPASMAAALRVLSDFGEVQAKRVFVFGEMLGLGAGTDEFHRDVVRQAVDLPIDAILPIGARAIAACKAQDDPRIALLSREDIGSFVTEQFTAPTVILVKGSRALRLETLVEELAHGC